MNKLIKQITVLSTLIGITVSAFLFLDSRHAASAKVSQVILQISYLEKKLQRNDLENQLEYLERRMWRYKEKFGENLEKASEFVKGEYKRLQKEVEKILRRLEALNKGE